MRPTQCKTRLVALLPGDRSIIDDRNLLFHDASQDTARELRGSRKKAALVQSSPGRSGAEEGNLAVWVSRSLAQGEKHRAAALRIPVRARQRPLPSDHAIPLRLATNRISDS
jgi:hypothetical protein